MKAHQEIDIEFGEQQATREIAVGDVVKLDFCLDPPLISFRGNNLPVIYTPIHQPYLNVNMIGIHQLLCKLRVRTKVEVGIHKCFLPTWTHKHKNTWACSL